MVKEGALSRQTAKDLRDNVKELLGGKYSGTYDSLSVAISETGFSTIVRITDRDHKEDYSADNSDKAIYFGKRLTVVVPYEPYTALRLRRPKISEEEVLQVGNNADGYMDWGETSKRQKDSTLLWKRVLHPSSYRHDGTAVAKVINGPGEISVVDYAKKVSYVKEIYKK